MAPVFNLFLTLTGEADVLNPSAQTVVKTWSDDHSARVLVRDYLVNE